jgi:NAD(P)-dependent dehydrogenase (short-subunit alcohol dehydrogenase family)
MTTNLLNGKRALVTGAASGMGASIATALAAEGAAVAIHARHLDQLEGTAAAISALGGHVLPVAAELRNAAAIAAMAQQTLDGLGGLDILVNNAGVVDIATVLEMDEELWDRTFDTNLKAPWLLTRALLPAVLAAGANGRLIFTSSISGKLSEAAGSAYNASKAGLIGFVRCLAAEVAPQGVTANAICPGWVDTPMATWCWQQVATAEGKPFADVYEAGMRNNMLRALIEPKDIAAMAVFLASGQSRFITAQAFNVCGGLCYW